MFPQNIGLSANHFEDAPTIRVVNRTGATSVKGGIVFLDISPSGTCEAESLTGSTPTPKLMLNNAVMPSTARMALSPIAGAWKTAGIADNDEGEIIVGDGVLARVNVETTTDITVGATLKPSNGQDYFVLAVTAATVDPTATAGTFDRYYGIALEARASNDEGPILAMLFSSGRR